MDRGYVILALVSLCSLQAATALEGFGVRLDSSAWLKRSNKFSRRFVLEDMQPVPARGTCYLTWYSPKPPAFGNKVLCSGSDDTCLEPCSSGYEMLVGSDICLQKCPEEAAGPAHLCPISRTCIRGESVCPMLADVPYACTAPDQLMGACAKQSYQAVVATGAVNITCEKGLVLQDHTGSWRCMSDPDQQPCSTGFTSVGEMQAGIGTRCKQVCPPWLVDCGDSCHMPGFPCNAKPDYLCPVVPLTACDLSQRTNLALHTACQSVGYRTTTGCPLALTMHGSCGGPQLQVAVGLRSQGFVNKVEVWWGTSGPAQSQPATDDGPLEAIRISFTGDKAPEVFGNESLTYAMSPRVAFSMGPAALVVSSRLWSSTTVMEGSRLTPVLAGFEVFTGARNLRTAGVDKNGQSTGGAGVAAAAQAWQRAASLSGADLGFGLPVGAAAYSSGSAIHAFGLLYLTRVAKQEL